MWLALRCSDKDSAFQALGRLSKCLYLRGVDLDRDSRFTADNVDEA